jgi:predicted house-cleaning noncanonical NTP pyrophosphatase (MazG superfamily)
VSFCISIRKQLQDVKQNVEESIEELTERVQETATDGYSEAIEDIVELIAVDAFLKGCNDKLLWMKIHPESIKRYNPSRAQYIIRTSRWNIFPSLT